MQGVGGKVNSTFNIQQGKFNVQLAAHFVLIPVSGLALLWQK